MTGRFRTLLMASTAALAGLMAGSAASARTADFSIPAEDLGRALRDFAKATGSRMIVASDLVAGKISPGVSGASSPDTALARLLAGSGLHYDRVAGAYVIRRDRTAAVPAAEEDKREILVTGTRIHGAGPIGAPLTIIDRKDIDTSGIASVGDYLRTIPQNFPGAESAENYGIDPHGGDNIAYGSSINLRGLGAESTLTLFDGNRPAVGGTLGAFVDTSLIPSGAIDRVEILTDGASAIYGTDAVAGVVNIRFRNHFNGFETHIFSGLAGGGYAQQQASQVTGGSWAGGALLLAYQYDHHSRLQGSDRRFATEDLRPWGGPDLRSPFSAPGTIIAADGESFAIPSGQDGRQLSAADLTPGANLTDRRRMMDILPRTTTHSVYAGLDQDLSGSVSVYARALYAHREFDAQQNANPPSGFSVPTDNPFYVDPIGTDEPITVDYDFSRELGPVTQAGHLSAVTTSAGFKARPGRWSIDLNGSFGHQVEIVDERNAVSGTRVRLALADPDPSTALNLFGDGTGNNPATLAFIRRSTHNFDRSTVWSTAVRIDGPLFSLPAGTVKLAAGAEHRFEHFSAGYTYDSLSPMPGIFDLYRTPATPGSRHVDAVYAELSIPILASETSEFPGKLDASLAGRIDWYSDVGRTTNPKAGLSWTPVHGITLRGSWGTAFRAPSIFERGSPDFTSYQTYPAPDPTSSTGTTPVLIQTGYSAHMRPEKATSWTAGFDLKPDALPGFSASASYFSIAYRDRIASPISYLPNILARPADFAPLIEAATADRVAQIYASPLFADYYGIPAGSIRYILHLELQNLSRQTVRGVDFDIRYAHDLFGGSAALGLSGTRLLAMDQQIDAGGPVTDTLGEIYNPVRWRLRGHGGWTRGGFSADAFVNYSGGYLNNQVSPAEHVDSWTTLDAQIGYRFRDASPLKGARIALSATNLLNTAPPYVLNSVYGQTTAYDPGQASAIGRLVSMELTFSW